MKSTSVKHFAFILFIVHSFSVSAQTFQFGINLGRWVEDYAIDIDKVSDGSVLTTSTNTAFGLQGLYKLDDTGSIVWTFNEITGATSDFYSFLSTTTDEFDNIYSLVAINSIPGLSFEFNKKTYYSGINLLKINSKGEVIWVKSMGSFASNGAKVLYKNNNIYVLGQFQDEIKVDNQYTVKSQKFYDCNSWIYRSGLDFLIAKFESNGRFIKAINYGEDYDDYIIDASIDYDENIYFVGISDLHPCTNQYSVLIKFKSDLSFNWKIELSKFSNASGLLYPSNIHISKNNKIYVWGHNFQDVITNNYKLEKLCTIAQNRDMPTANLLEFDTTNGNFLRKYQFTNCTVNKVFATQGSYFTQHINKGLMADFENDLIIFTSFKWPITFSNGTFFPSFNSIGYMNENLLLMKMNLIDFKPYFITNFKAENGANTGNPYPTIDNPNALIIDNENNLYISGAFVENPLMVLGNKISNNSGNGDTDVLFIKLNMNNLLDLNSIISTQKNITVFPNPTNKLLNINYNDEIDEIRIYDYSGKLMFEKKSFSSPYVDLSFLSYGTYLIDFYYKNVKIGNKKIIKNN